MKMRSVWKYCMRWLAGSAIVAATSGTGGLAAADVIGVDAVHGFDPDAVLATGQEFEELRATITGLGHTLVPIFSFEAADLAGLDALFVVQPYVQNFADYTASEIEAIHALVATGRGLVVCADDGGGFNVTNMNALVADFGITYADDPTSGDGHTITGFVSHPVTEGLGMIGVDFHLVITTVAPSLDLTTGSGEDDALSALALPGMRVVFSSDTGNWTDPDAGSQRPISFGDNRLLLENVIHYVTGCRRIDFEVDDEGVTLAHGQHLADGDPEFDGGSLFGVTLTSSLNGSGLATAAILDSTTGPAAQDPDLLVARDNILILQTDTNLSECPPGSGVYCSHNDDEDGGRLTFSFEDPAEPESLALIDIDATDGPSAVVLTDAAGAQRTYAVPAGWTGDLIDDGQGTGMLDLTLLADQPGFAATATASEDAGFQPEGVIRIDVLLGGSGGVDELVWCAGAQQASIASRNGSDVNRVSLTSHSPPVIGGTWVANLDCRPFGDGLATLFVCRSATSGLMTPYGEQLIAGPLLHRSGLAFAGSESLLTWMIPNDPALIGLDVHAQGRCMRTSASLPGKARALRGGLSNALDMILGF